MKQIIIPIDAAINAGVNVNNPAATNINDAIPNKYVPICKLNYCPPTANPEKSILLNANKAGVKNNNPNDNANIANEPA